MARNYEDCEDSNIKIQNSLLKVTETDNKKIVDFYLVNEIEDIEDYIDFLRAVDSCTINDEIIVHINNYGGVVEVALNIYDCLKCSDANVIISIEGVCASSASMIMLSANGWQVSPHSYVMIHAWSGDIFGKWNEQESQFEFNKTWLKTKFKEIYKNFLNDKEIEDCLGGKDFYFDSEETIKRLNNFRKDEVDKEVSINKIKEKYRKMAEKEISEYLKKK